MIERLKQNSSLLRRRNFENGLNVRLNMVKVQRQWTDPTVQKYNCFQRPVWGGLQLFLGESL